MQCYNFSIPVLDKENKFKNLVNGPIVQTRLQWNITEVADSMSVVSAITEKGKGVERFPLSWRDLKLYIHSLF